MVEDHISPSCYKLLELHMTNSSGWQQMDMLEYLEKCSGPRRFSSLKTSKKILFFFDRLDPLPLWILTISYLVNLIPQTTTFLKSCC